VPRCFLALPAAGYKDSVRFVCGQESRTQPGIEKRTKEKNMTNMTINLALGPVVSLFAGILILIVPRLLNYIVAIYLILIGLIGIFGWGSMHTRTSASVDHHPSVSAPPAYAPVPVTTSA
jgi:Protein of unknown function (DUF3096)